MKTLLFTLILLATIPFAQAQDFSKKTNAFRNSYTAESAGNYATAVKELENLNDKSYEVQLRLGWLNYLQKNYSGSINHYKLAIAASAQSIEARLGLVYPLTALENYNEVLKTYLDILKIDPNHSKAHYWAAYSYFYRKDYTKASEHLAKILTLYPFDYDANVLQAQSLLARGKLVEAKTHYQRALLYSPSNKEIEAVIEKL